MRVSEAPVRWSYTMADIDAMAKAAVGIAVTASHILDGRDRYECAWFAICEALYVSDEQEPPRGRLIQTGIDAISHESADQLRHHGARRVGTSTGANFERFWYANPDWFEDSLCERMSLPQMLAVLTASELEALVAAATFDDLHLAAEAVGISYGAIKQLTYTARKKIRGLWHEHETPRQPAADRCRSGHARADHGFKDVNDKWQCRECRRINKRARYWRDKETAVGLEDTA